MQVGDDNLTYKCCVVCAGDLRRKGTDEYAGWVSAEHKITFQLLLRHL